MMSMNKNVKRRLQFVLIVMFALSPFIEAKPSFSYGLTTGTGSWGIGVNALIEKTETFSWIADLRYYDIKGEHEFSLQSQYGGTYLFNEQSLIVFPMFAGIRKSLFHDKIDNNFIPFVETMAGAVFVMDGDESVEGFFSRWKQAPSYLSVGGYIGGGILFWFPNQSTITIRAGFDYLPMFRQIDGKTTYHGAVVQILFNRQK